MHTYARIVSSALSTELIRARGRVYVHSTAEQRPFPHSSTQLHLPCQGHAITRAHGGRLHNPSTHHRYTLLPNTRSPHGVISHTVTMSATTRAASAVTPPVLLLAHTHTHEAEPHPHKRSPLNTTVWQSVSRFNTQSDGPTVVCASNFPQRIKANRYTIRPIPLQRL